MVVGQTWPGFGPGPGSRPRVWLSRGCLAPASLSPARRGLGWHAGCGQTAGRASVTRARSANCHASRTHAPGHPSGDILPWPRRGGGGLTAQIVCTDDFWSGSAHVLAIYFQVFCSPTCGAKLLERPSSAVPWPVLPCFFPEIAGACRHPGLSDRIPVCFVVAARRARCLRYHQRICARAGRVTQLDEEPSCPVCR